MPLHTQILLAIALAAAVGLVLPDDAALGPVGLMGVFEFFGTLFLNALKMIVVPLVVS